VTIALDALAALGIAAFLLALRIAVRSYLDERADFVRTPAAQISRHPELTGIALLREISFGPPDGPRVAGWYAPPRNGAAIVLVHGTGAERSSLLPESQMLSRAGFGILALDLPGHGKSEGRSQWGLPERRAISAAVDWLTVRPDVNPDRIGALGMSMGGYVLTQAAAVDARIRAVVLVSTPHDVVAQNWHASRRWGLLSQLPCHLALRASGMPLDMRPLDIAGTLSPRPLLVIAGALDDLVTPTMAERIFCAAGEPKELHVVAGAHHTDFVTAAPDEYRRILVGFLTRSVLGSDAAITTA
jgi:dipeptidyl aminopeptidase/acylaminoacyl peptidase